MSENTEMSPGQAGNRDKDSDKDALSTQRETPPAIDNDSDTAPSRQRQTEQESALERWETEGGAEERLAEERLAEERLAEERLEDGREEGAEDRTDSNKVAESGQTDTGEHAG